MAENKQAEAPADAVPETTLEGGTYEIIRRRLREHSDDLRGRLDELNAARKKVFGSIETQMLSSERITTENNCIPRDMVPVGNRFLFGYNVFVGLRAEVKLEDVFAVYRYEEQAFHAEPLDLLGQEAFVNDFKHLYKYYRDTRFTMFARIGSFLYMVFQIGKEITDIKAFKWAMGPDGLTYIDNRSDHEVVFPDQHGFRWKRTSRDNYRQGDHPHISIEDRVFVETIGGDLTIKVEDNTKSGKGIYAEPVEHHDQTLDDAEVHYAIVGHLIILKIRPYQERRYRYIIFNEKLQSAIRVDALEDACVLLPDDHGLIFARGYYLQTGEFKLFENELDNMIFEKQVKSPNGEDFLYVFYNKLSGLYTLLSYNLIEQEVETPILCHGFSIFPNGEMAYFRDDNEAKKHHVVQIWQTPYVDPNHTEQKKGKGYLSKLGNKEIVRAMAECREVLKLTQKDDSYSGLYLDLVSRTRDILDSYHWLNKKEAAELQDPLSSLNKTASQAIEEFEKVREIRKNTADEVKRVTEGVDKALRSARASQTDDIYFFVNNLADLRALRGEVISLRELRYVDMALVEAQEQEIATATERLSQGCVTFLLKDTALNPYRKKVEELDAAIEKLVKVVDANRIEEEINETSSRLEMLIDIVSNLKIEDATQTTGIIDSISAIYTRFNQIIAALRKKRKSLRSSEGKAEFNAQLKLINQGMLNYLDLAETPDKCDEYLSRLMVQLEELEGKFAEFDEFLERIQEKREDLYNAFEARKANLVDERNRQANRLMQSAERILGGVQNRVSKLETVAEINGYFAGDLMVDKVRTILDDLRDLGETVKVDDVQSRLKSVREEAVRQLKDRTELFADGDDVISFGKHRFLVNRQALDLSILPRDGGLAMHLAGTNFYEAVKADSLAGTEEVWEQSLVSESNEVYRGEYLAWLLFTAAQSGDGTLPSLEALQQKTANELADTAQGFMSTRFDEGYTKGVHDRDSAHILEALITLHQSLGQLRFPADVRAAGVLFWEVFVDEPVKERLSQQLSGLSGLMKVFPDSGSWEELKKDLTAQLSWFCEETKLFPPDIAEQAAHYLFEELSADHGFVASHNSVDLQKQFDHYLTQHQHKAAFDASLAQLADQPAARFRLLHKWVSAFLPKSRHPEWVEHTVEAAVWLFLSGLQLRVVNAPLSHPVDSISGTHSSLEGDYELHYHHFADRLRGFTQDRVPMFRQFQELKKDLVQAYRDDLRLDEFKPRIMSSFVRNQLINKVYLPIIGDNLAKQMGTAGENKRTDLMGMLLLISPPGYGKTTLMEYIANRLGIIFMKINGPAIGHRVTSLDPAEAPNASAREELEKLNLAFEMGDNIMIYLDDIQHCDPELLQKFISLCDGQRKIEGVYKGRSKTYDLRGRKVAVVMAGNPYTESGDKFRIPDMLANRADIYNLGDILGGTEAEFKMSYLENSMTSNTTLNRLAGKSQKDLYPLLEMVEQGREEGLEFEASHSEAEMNEYRAVLEKLIHARDIILQVNQEYIRSAGQADEYRTEPPFKLQGSYRNMNKIAEQIVPVMNQEELDQLIMNYYENEAQTLTTGAEANLLKFRELTGTLDDESAARWEEIKTTFRKNNRLRGLGDNQQMTQVLSSMEAIAEGLTGIRKAIVNPETAGSSQPVQTEQHE